MVEKVRKVQFPCIPDDVPLWSDDRMILSNDDLIINKRGQALESRAGSFHNRVEKVATPVEHEHKVETRSSRTEKFSSTRESIKYDSPKRPKEYVYPTDRPEKVDLNKSQKRPLGPKNTANVGQSLTYGVSDPVEAKPKKVTMDQEPREEVTHKQKTIRAHEFEKDSVFESPEEPPVEEPVKEATYFEKKRNALFDVEEDNSKENKGN